MFAHLALAEDLETSHGHSSGTLGITDHRYTNNKDHKGRCMHTTKPITKITMSVVCIERSVCLEISRYLLILSENSNDMSGGSCNED